MGNRDTAISRTAVNYADLKKQKRIASALALASRVAVPVKARVAAKSDTRGATSKLAKAVVYVFGAIFVHGAIVGSLGAFTELRHQNENEVIVEKVIFQTVDSLAELEKSTEKDLVEAELEIEEKETVETPVKDARKPLPVKRERRLSADPVEKDAEEAPTERRRIVGLSLSSTVKSGTGPSFAIGNTRMGETARVAEVDKAERLGKGDVNDNRTGREVDSPNRVAAGIPTTTVSFTKPERISPATLDYPVELKSRGIEGNVVVLIVIDTEGRVQRVRIIKSSGYPQFDEAAKVAAQKEMFSPAKRNGSAVEYNLKYTYRFRIKGA